MAELPSGTVTFLFTDVEGSTRLLKQLRERYGEVLAEHRRILRAAFDEHGGQEIDTQGDAFFVAFRKARDAALAAIEAQRGLAEHEWTDGVELRVRMGMHTGEPSVGDEGYHGLGLHRAARIMAAGHGGQVLLSQATCSVLEDDELPGIGIRDLGQHPLKDLDRPERIYQLDIDGLPADFPLLRTAEAPTAYTGRVDDLEGAARAAFWRGRLRTRRRRVAAIGAVLLAAGLIAAGVAVLGRSGTAKALSQVDANAVGVVDPGTGKVADEVTVGATPSHFAVEADAIWVTNTDDDSVSRIDPATREVVQTIAVGSSPSGITAGNGAIWVANSLDSTVSRIDPKTNREVQTTDVGNEPVGIVSAPGSIWVANTGDDTITRIDPASGKRTKTTAVAADELAYGAGALWASQRTENRVARIDPATGKVVSFIRVGNGPAGVAYGSRSVWVANGLDGTVSRIDPSTNSVPATIQVGNGPISVAVGPDGVWVSNQFGGTLARIDPRTNDVVQRIGVGNRPQGVAVSGTDVLVAVRQSGVGHRGGTLTFRMNRSPDTTDTGIAYDSVAWTILRMTNDGLVAFNQASGLAGTQPVPDLAVSLPAATDDGKIYTFQLRPNIRYSNGRPVKASDFRATFERDFEVNFPVPYYYDNIVGAKRCEQQRKHCDLSKGIVTDDAAGTVAFHLLAADPAFLDKLALPFAYVQPRGTPSRPFGNRPLPATGPYRIASYRPKHLLRLVRNPYFHEWSKPAQPDGYPEEIVFRIGGTPDEAVKEVLRGKADVFSTSQSQTPPSEGQLAALETQHASQVRVNPEPATVGLFLNTRVPPFDRLDVRRALNYAADRTAAVSAVGGSEVARATCQILPADFPGYSHYCPYGEAPDLAKARKLVRRSGTLGMKVKMYSWSDFRGVGPFAAKLLRSLGYRVSVKPLPNPPYFGLVSDSRTKAQIGTEEWISDYPAASGFIIASLTCASFLPADPGNSNRAQFCDPKIDRQIGRALSEQTTNADAARGLWERIDHRMVDQAPWVPLVNPKIVDVLSSRVRNYQYSVGNVGPLIDQLWVR